MKEYPEPIDLKKVKVYPLAERQSLSAIDSLLTETIQQFKDGIEDGIRDAWIKISLQ